MDSKLLNNLLMINLLFLAFLLFSKLIFIHRFIQIIFRFILIPIIISIFLYYIIRPLNNIFIKRHVKRGFSALLTLIISFFILLGILTYFSSQIALQFDDIVNQLSNIIGDDTTKKGIIYKVERYVNLNDTYKYITNMSQNYFRQLALGIVSIIGYILNTFSTLLLVIIIVFYMLKDGRLFKEKLVSLVPHRYKDISYKILSEINDILYSYVTGQAKVALSLTIMMLISYKIIHMPNALLFCSITFILAFIPFIGFFISMVIPIIIAISIGLSMLIKLVIVFAIIQTLKGRIIVPIIMSRALKIHPLTDIFLVIGAITIGGPVTAFIIVPMYVVLKSVIKNIFTNKKHA